MGESIKFMTKPSVNFTTDVSTKTLINSFKIDHIIKEKIITSRVSTVTVTSNVKTSCLELPTYSMVLMYHMLHASIELTVIYRWC